MSDTELVEHYQLGHHTYKTSCCCCNKRRSLFALLQYSISEIY